MENQLYEDTIMTVEEISKILKISQYTLRQYCREGKVPYFRCGSKLLFRKEKIIFWIEEQEKNNYKANIN